MKVKGFVILVVMILIIASSNFLMAEQKSQTLSHKPTNTGYAFSVNVVWNIIQCFDIIKINIGADVNKDFSRIEMKNVGGWIAGGCYGQAFDVNSMSEFRHVNIQLCGKWETI